MFDYVLNVSLLALGFGFVIFWHELGHFLAAKYVGIKVEQFAVGFGNAMLAWRKGVGIRIGTTRPEYEKRVKEHVAKKDGKDASAEIAQEANLSTEQIDAATKELGLGETEYRLNWIPLGGYVKMLGQDDMNPNAVSTDPRAYPQKSVGARMLVISAGVIMNIILAAILFMGLFMLGHKVPPAVIGGILPGSPAQRVTQIVNGKSVTTSLAVGDRILELDGVKQDDWTKVGLTSALADASEPTSIAVRHVDGTTAKYMISPEKDMASRQGRKGFLVLGVEQPKSLRFPDSKLPMDEAELAERNPADYFAIKPGDTIVGVDGQSLKSEDPKDGSANDYYKLDAAVQAAGKDGGRPVELRIQRKNGAVETVQSKIRALPTFGKDPLNFAGMLPRTTVMQIAQDSSSFFGFVKKPAPAKGVLKPEDVIVRLVSANDPVANPTFDELTTTLNRAAKSGQHVEISVLRGDKELVVKVEKFRQVDKDRYGLGFAPGFESDHAVVSGTLDDSPAARAGVPKGAMITAVNGTAVRNWFHVQRLISKAAVEQSLVLTAKTGDKESTYSLTLTEVHRDAARNARYAIAPMLTMSEQVMIRKASNPAQAAWWGVTETRDFILQFYVTIRRMFDGSVSYTNLMGPLGIFTAGTQFAFRGMDWLIWFLAMISANLAVVNFLPIPVVDGGHFVFLLLEKIQGKPVSQRAQSIAQVVGLALLLGVFLLVTYQDISRMVSSY